MSELFWAFLIQGIIFPGFNPSNQELPFFSLTEYGQQECTLPGRAGRYQLPELLHLSASQVLLS